MGTAACYVMLVRVLLWIAGREDEALPHPRGRCDLPMVAIAALSADYRRARLLSFLRPEADPLGAGFQALQSLIAVGAGGLFGSGLGAQPAEALLPAVSAHRLHLRDRRRGARVHRRGRSRSLPSASSRGGVSAPRGARPTRSAAFWRPGATAMIVVQAAINMSVVLALLPTKGLPLPFVSYGGSSLVASWIAAGLILNVSQHEVRTTGRELPTRKLRTDRAST